MILVAQYCLLFLLLTMISMTKGSLRFSLDEIEFKEFVDTFVTKLVMNSYNERDQLSIQWDTSYHCRGNKEAMNVNLFILGDSIDRYFVEDFCRVHYGQFHDWEKRGNFSYKVGAASALTCMIGQVKIGVLNIYGTNPKGPYFRNHTNVPDDPYADTELRIPHGIQTYQELFGIPNFVIFRGDLWDMHPLSSAMTNGEFDESNINKTELINHMIHTYTEDFKQIKTLLPNAYIGTHTVPQIKWGAHLFSPIQNLLRYLSAENLGLFLFDLNLMTMDFNPNKVLRDVHHPNRVFSLYFGNLLVHVMQQWLQNTCILNNEKSEK